MMNILRCSGGKYRFVELSKPVLLCGLDFSGKSTIAETLAKSELNKYEIRKKYLSLTKDPLEKIRNMKTSLSAIEWIDLWTRIAEEDVTNWVSPDKILILDSLAPFKHYALIAAGLEVSSIPDMTNFATALHSYPQMKVFFIDVPYEERMRRMGKRNNLSVTDKLVADRVVGTAVKHEYIKILNECFGSMIILDNKTFTSEENTETIIKYIQKTK